MEGGSPAKETFLVLAERATPVGSIRSKTRSVSFRPLLHVLLPDLTEVNLASRNSTSPLEPVSRLLAVSIHSLSSTTWDAYDPSAAAQSSADPSNSELIREFQYYDSPAPTAPPIYDHPLAGMKKILEAGSFYFAGQDGEGGDVWDISSRLEERLRRDTGEGVSQAEAGQAAASEDRRFVWNAYLLKGMRKFREGLEPTERDEFETDGYIVSRRRSVCTALRSCWLTLRVITTAPSHSRLCISVHLFCAQLHGRRAGLAGARLSPELSAGWHALLDQGH